MDGGLEREDLEQMGSYVFPFIRTDTYYMVFGNGALAIPRGARPSLGMVDVTKPLKLKEVNIGT